MTYDEIISTATSAVEDEIAQNGLRFGSPVLSACLFATLNHRGIHSEVVHGAVTLGRSERSIFHSWVEVEGRIIDTSIAQKVSSDNDATPRVIFGTKADLKSVGLSYFSYEELPEDVKNIHPIGEVQGKNTVRFLDAFGSDTWRLVCAMLGEPVSDALVSSLRSELLYTAI